MSAPSRDWLLGMLREIIELAMGHVRSEKTPKPDRIKWSRILIAASQACNSVLRDVEIERLKEEIEQLKALVKERLEAAVEGTQERAGEAQGAGQDSA